MPKKKLHRTEERNEEVYQAYLELNKGLGEMASCTSQNWKYTELADRFFLTPKTISIIVCKKLRERNASPVRDI